MPPSPVNPPVKPPPPQTSAFDGEVIGADRTAPADQLAVGPQIVVRPGDEEAPVRLEPAPGWYVDRDGVVYSKEQQRRMIGSPSPGRWRLENGVRVFRPNSRAPEPEVPAGESESAR
jgi:hypothetical protein